MTRIGNGGSRGGSKSGGGRRCIILRRLEYPKTTGLILRRTFPELYKSHIIKCFEEFPETRQWYRDSPNHEIIFPNGSRLFFGSAPHAKAMSAFYSAEFADVLVDEAQEFSQDELERLSGSVRCTSNNDIIAKMVMAFMPGPSEEAGLPPIGLSYLKRVLVDALTKPSLLTKEERNEKWAFVQAFAWDNIEWFRKELSKDRVGVGAHQADNAHCPCQDCEFYSWPEHVRRDYFIQRTEFGRKLSAITRQELRDAWLYGLWNKFEGQFFTNWNPERHVISKEEVRERIKPWHVRWVSGDWGYEHPHDIQWHVIDELGRIITYRESWDREMGETELGQKIGRLTAGEKLRGFPFSWDAGKLSSRSHATFPKSINQMISDALPPGHPKPHPADSSPGSRIARARLMSNLLDTDIGGIPAWQVSEECTHLIACMPSLLRDPKNSEDVLKVDFCENEIGDDPYDCAAIGLQYMQRMRPKPDSEKIADAIKGIKSPTQRMIRTLQMEQDFRQRRQPVTRSGDWRRRLEEQ